MPVTTYADGSSIANKGGSNAAGYPAVTIFENTFDASKRPLVATDVVELIKIPANSFVLKVMYKVITGDATQTLNIGDGSAVAGYVAAADVGTAGNSGVGAGSLATGKFYAAADTIDLEVPATKALDTLVVKVVAVVAVMG
jgi:hypothetical protein